MTDAASDQARIARWGVAVLALLVLYRCWVLWAGQLPLDLEETYYLYWSSQPALGYYSKPPVTAWLLAVATGLFGTTPLVIKSVSLLLHTGTALLVYAIGRRLWSPAAGWIGAVTFYSLPVIGMLSLFTSTDAPLHFFWALTVWAFLKARDTDRLGWWLVAGVGGGLGLMSKYTMGVLAIGLLGYLLSTPAYRRLLLRPGLWLAVLLAFLVWLPNLWWNYRHDFISFRHTAEIAQLDHAWLRPDMLLEFLLPQWPMFGLLLAPLLLLNLRRLAGDDGGRLLLWVSLPMLAVISLQALLSEANINWASASYVGLSLLAGAGLWRLGRKRWLVAALVLNLALLSAIYHVHGLASALGIELTAKTDPYRKRLGWDVLGAQLKPLLAERPGALLVSDSRSLLAYLGYHGSDWPPELAQWNPARKVHSQYQLLGNDRLMAGRLVVFVSKHPLDDAILSRFGQARELGVLRAPLYRDFVREVHVYELRDFRGYGQ